jgi:BMFP domain-containing protein YqiC
MPRNATTPRRPRGRPVVGTRKEFPIQSLIDAQTREGMTTLLARLPESESGLIRRAVQELLHRELQAA